MEDRHPLDLQREADDDRPTTDEDPRSARQADEETERLDQFKQGRLDRWGRPVDGLTRMSDFYIERRDPDELW